MPATFGDVYRWLRERYAGDQQALGVAFERLVAEMLRTDPQFARYRRVWLWSEWPGRDGADHHTDIVAEIEGGGLAAIQCKCYDPDATIPQNMITSFLAYTNAQFTERLIVSTSSHWTKNSERMITNQQPPVQRLDLFGLEATNIDWDAWFKDKRVPLVRRPRRTALPHQLEAISDVRKGLGTYDRGQLIAACGSGKTLMALRIAEQTAGTGGRVLFAAPSISLVAQALREWGRDAEIPIRAVAVCSDPKVTARSDGDSARSYDLPIPATTDPTRLAEAALRDAPGQLTVVFSTYQSMDVIRRAQRAGMPEFDLVVCDEAHRTTGHDAPERDRSSFLLVHDEDAVRARKRLYMTATPRLYGDAGKRKAQEHGIYLASMDDEAVYGPELHRLGFASAVEQGLLSDYRVVVLVINEETVARDFQRHLGNPDVPIGDIGRVAGCLNGLAKLDPAGDQFATDPGPMRRAVAFSNTIRASKDFVDLIGAMQNQAGTAERGIDVEARHIDGTDSVATRSGELAWLGTDTAIMGNRVHILSNARCLTEGIDVPSLDAALFLQPRKSQIDVVQAVGRVMRRAEGKDYGYIILPVVIPADLDPSSALDRDEAYGHVWQVLQALRSHDERFDAWVANFDLTKQNDGRVRIIGVGGPGEDGNTTGERASSDLQSGLDLDWARHQDAILGRIVERVGDRRYWEQWAASVGRIASTHRTRLDALISGADTAVAARFDTFLAALRHNLNDSITRDDAAAMLSQHLITRPVFDALFGSSTFAALNPVSQVMEEMLTELGGRGLEAETRELNDFYASIRRRVEGVDSAEGRQRVASDLYDHFFRKAFPRDAERLGIVYTPVEIVDFIIRSVADLLEEHFGASLGDEGVHILDPFTGTGTFITRLISSGLIATDDLPRTYRAEFHANELMLLAYYIAAVNIENAYQDAKMAAGKPSDYEPFDGMVLTDTFQMSEEGDPTDRVFFPRNNERAERQLGLDIRVIVSNPPWSRMQRSQSDMNANQPYPTLDASIEAAYAAASAAGLKAPLYDSYVRAIRWASNRVQDSPDGGVVGFVTNGSFINVASFDGFRKAVAREFHEVYVYNLRGNTRGSGESVRREGGKVFGQGSRATVAVLLLVKRPGAVTASATIHYRDIGDYLSRERKLEIVAGSNLGAIDWDEIAPNEAGDWINQRSERFTALRPLAPVPSQPSGEAPIFGMSSLGLVSNRDAWVFHSSADVLRDQVERQAAFFNEQVQRFTPPGGPAAKRLAAARAHATRDDTRFRWTRGSEQRLSRGQGIQIGKDGYRLASYRPFFRQRLYMDRALNEMPNQMPRVFPVGIERVPGVFVVNAGRAGAIGVVATDTIPPASLASLDPGRFFPRYLPAGEISAGSQGELLPTEAREHRDNINPEAFAAYRAHLGENVTADQLFAYVYGVLHAPEYRARYANDLIRLLPRIPNPADAATFSAFADAGQSLLDLHIGYEQVEPYPLDELVASDAPAAPRRYRVTKMRWGGSAREPDYSRIVFNDWITLGSIPEDVHSYTIGSRSALAWLLDRYQVKKDKGSGIVNDVNLWSEEQGEPRYILDLVKRIVTVSVETMAVVRALPELREA